MKDKMMVVLSHTLRGYLTESNAAPTVQRVFRSLQTSLGARCSFLALQNPSTAYLEIAHSYEVTRSAIQGFRRKIGQHAIGRIFFTDHLLVLTKDSAPEEYAEFLLEQEFEMVIAAHLGYGGHSIGFLASYFDHPVELDIATRNFFLALAGACSAALEKEELLNTVNSLRRHDPETGVFCHQFFTSRLDEEICKSLRYGEPLTLITMDVDNFKSIINQYGIETAIDLLRDIGKDLHAMIRGCDAVGRIGVDELMVCMPNTPLDQADIVMRRFKDQVENKVFTSREVKTSLTFGMTVLHSDDSLDSLLTRVQVALYNGRKLGKASLHVIP
jgi:diguanylate cyclase (GGDEF)-like protein